MSMRNFFKKVRLSRLAVTQIFFFYLNELVCRDNFFRKLHPSEWVKKISNNYFCKICVNFFKTSCNTVALIFGFARPFLNLKATNVAERFGVPVVKNVKDFAIGMFNGAANAAGINNEEKQTEYNQDCKNWDDLVHGTELLKLAVTHKIYDSIDSWYSKVVLQDTPNAKQLMRSINSLCDLSLAVNAIVEQFDSQKDNNSIRITCTNKGCFDSQINDVVKKIRTTNTLVSQKLASCSDALERLNNQANPSLVNSLA